MNKDKKLRVGITPGDTNGIGYELILKTFADEAMLHLCIPIIYGSPKTATYHRKATNSQTNFVIVDTAEEAESGRLNLISCYDEEIKIDFGQPSSEAGEAARRTLEKAVRDLKEHKVDVLVTAPINKANISGEKFPYNGHTEYLQASLDEGGGDTLMILTGSQLRVGLATTHLPLRDVATSISAAKLESKLRLFVQSLRRDFSLTNPRVAVLGLNPHCGENGLIGKEDKEILIPVIQKLSEEGLPVFGPYASDGFFGAGHYTRFDGILAMYHDQGLIPFKLLNMEAGVNFTAGLAYIRTSPDHGTAYEIAGQGVASEASFRSAVYAAIDIYWNRLRADEATQNPLQRLYNDRREEERPRRHPREQRENPTELA